MALHTLQELHIGVPDVDMLNGFYQEIGFVGGAGTWGSADRPEQIKLTQAPYRQLTELLIACDDEADLAGAAVRLDELGVAHETSNGRMTVIDPINHWRYVLTPSARADVSLHEKRLMNFPGERNRLGSRAEVLVEDSPRTPRRLGHVVVGSPEPAKTTELCQALGFRVSDTIGGGIATFLRCSHDHHNLLVTPGPVPYLNHYALEHDDFDAVLRAATVYIREHGDEINLSGPGRHPIGGNIFWYMRDPSGTFFEFFADMDQIADDAAWEIKHDWDPATAWSIWGEARQPEVFFAPQDIQTVIEGFNAQHG